MQVNSRARTSRELLPASGPDAPPWAALPGKMLHWSGVLLVGASWVSAGMFALYILCFYLVALHLQQLQHWNENLPGLYVSHHAGAVGSMAAHLMAGATVLLFGPIQLMDPVRRRWLSAHRWMGRVYVLTCAVAGLGGTAFIVLQGTIGGPVMSTGFGLYGVLMVVASWQTYWQARSRHLAAHRAWGIRLFALAIGSWMYRMDYGLWLTAAHGLGHRPDFHGPFDAVMAFFYLPNLAVAELFLRGRSMPAHRGLRAAATFAVNLATLITGVGTYYFFRYYWGPAILHGVLSLGG